MKYRVKPGDTMYDIAKRYGVHFAELVALNPQVTDPDMINPGQLIEVPLTGISDKDRVNQFMEAAAQLDGLLKPLAGMLPPGTAARTTPPASVNVTPDYSFGPVYPLDTVPAYNPVLVPKYYGGPIPGCPGVMLPEESAVVLVDKAQIRILQQRLKKLKYYHGSLTGRIGPKTMNAVKKFQVDCGREASGEIDTFVRASLGI